MRSQFICVLIAHLLVADNDIRSDDEDDENEYSAEEKGELEKEESVQAIPAATTATPSARESTSGLRKRS